MSNRADSLWEKLSPAWQSCLEETWQAYCRGNVPIGAVITDQAGNILARGRNQRQGAAAPGDYLQGHPLAHAELIALLTLDYESVDPHTGILYTATEPCPLCMGAVYMSGVREVHYASRDPYAGSVNLLGTTPYLSRKPIRVVGPERSDLELIIMALYVDYALQDHVERAAVVFDQWAADVPASIELGKRLAASGTARQMRGQGAPAPVAFDQMANVLGV
jgi:tRNA(Arg) A34 adenosine deaminase TadA